MVFLNMTSTTKLDLAAQIHCVSNVPNTNHCQDARYDTWSSVRAEAPISSLNVDERQSEITITQIIDNHGSV
jgi:hypothetical protein